MNYTEKETMMIIKENVYKLMQKLEFPKDAQKVILCSVDKLLSDDDSRVKLSEIVAQYDKTVECDYTKMLEDMKALCEGYGIHEFTSNMILLLSLGEKLRERYTELGIDENIYYNSMADLRYKLEECRLVRNQVGTFVPGWYKGFFNLTRFALGRLQFEIVSLKEKCDVNGVHLPAGTKAINIHIPRTGTRLYHDTVEESYRLAAEFFADELKDQPTVFTCHSWMLYPWNIEALSQGSNMANFYNDFTIISHGDYDNYNEVWRLFDCLYEGDPNKLPADTSLRRAYVERMKEGKPLGWGHGVFVYNKKL